MPTLLLIKGFRFFFFNNEGYEPIHVHVTKGNSEGKIWLEPELSVAYFNGFSKSEEKDIEAIVSVHFDNFKIKWNEYFGKK